MTRIALTKVTRLLQTSQIWVVVFSHRWLEWAKEVLQDATRGHTWSAFKAMIQVFHSKSIRGV
ncbi:hypothetical protein EV363DRAFT_1178432 [Boletus edulis]|uniref:Uncharacterized protein n=1 Tax=Boletus edulis BED1 TaxID=1328754 RepID=A0AAD4BKQ8_BOLED|nr:hypothetical protein EV363DRAFT_1178432 [Boletus edulis]KAF8416366.1 hypothetical protein L210DRAFT_3582974 [Boletus edulis BED1]KAF8433761.1 hypothetical protein L210DRAFT_3556092 [Boletus edulis BED1]